LLLLLLPRLPSSLSFLLTHRTVPGRSSSIRIRITIRLVRHKGTCLCLNSDPDSLFAWWSGMRSLGYVHVLLEGLGYEQNFPCSAGPLARKPKRRKPLKKKEGDYL
jgi:hypothetical protein